jgi:histone H3/H4
VDEGSADTEEAAEATETVVSAETEAPAAPTPERKQVKRAKSSYFWFIGERRGAVKEANPGLGLGPMQKLLAEEWKKLTPEEKEKYDTLALEDKERYQREIAEFGPNEKKDKNAPIGPGELCFPLGECGATAARLARMITQRKPFVLYLRAARVKKLIKQDPDVKNISGAGSKLIAKATELFIAMLAEDAAAAASQNKRRTVKEEDFNEAVYQHDCYDWLQADFEK